MKPDLISSRGLPAITRKKLGSLQLNLGYLCNLSCVHCHINAGPNRTELMSKQTIYQVLAFTFNALQQRSDIVISPAQDGRYVMIGMKQAYSELFVDMTWGYAEVFEATQQKIKRYNLNSIETTMQCDDDTFEDFQRYQKEKLI